MEKFLYYVNKFVGIMLLMLIIGLVFLVYGLLFVFLWKLLAGSIYFLALACVIAVMCIICLIAALNA